MPTIKFSADIKPVTFKRPASNRKHRYDPKEYAAFNSEYGDIIWLHETLEIFDTEAAARVFIRKTVDNLNAEEINHVGS